jgi:site-specific recombinase XerC
MRHGKMGSEPRPKKLERLKAFIKFCVKREWLEKDIADDLQAPQGSSVTVPKSPLADEELDRLYTACDKIGPQLKQGPDTARGTARM